MNICRAIQYSTCSYAMLASFNMDHVSTGGHFLSDPQKSYAQNTSSVFLNLYFSYDLSLFKVSVLDRRTKIWDKERPCFLMSFHSDRQRTPGSTYNSFMGASALYSSRAVVMCFHSFKICPEITSFHCLFPFISWNISCYPFHMKHTWFLCVCPQ